MTDREGFYQKRVAYVLTVLTKGFRVQTRDGKLGFHRVEDPAEVEDITQETFAAFFRQVENGSFERDRPPTPYLRRIAVNLALRRAGRQAKEVPLEDAAEPSVPPSSTMEQAELRSLMADFRSQLSTRERAVVACLEDEELRSQAAVGARLGLSRDQVYRTLVNVRKRATAFFQDKGWLP